MSGFLDGRPFGDVVGQIFDYNGELLSVKYATLSTSASGATQVVAAVTGKRIHVVSGSLSAGGTTTATLTSGSSGMALTGALSLVANANTPIGEIRTNPGEALFVTNSAAVAIVVNVAYVESGAPWEGTFDASDYGSVIVGADASVLASRNAGAGAYGSAVSTFDPLDTKHRTVSTYKWTVNNIGHPVTFENTTYGGAIYTNVASVTTSTSPFYGVNADGMRGAIKNLSGLTCVYAGMLVSPRSTASNLFCVTRNVTASTRLNLHVNSNWSLQLVTRRADTDTATTNTTASAVGANDAPFVIVLSLNYAANQGNMWINGTQILTNVSISSSGAGTMSNTDSVEDLALMGPTASLTILGATFKGYCYLFHYINGAVSSTQAASITNHVRYLRGF